MKVTEENKYINIVSDIIHNGSRHTDRTGVGTRALFGKMMEFDLTDGKIPLPSTRKVPIRFLPIELVWFISGSTDIKFLLDNNVNIWNSWVIPETAVYDNNPRNIVKHFEKQGVIKLDKDYEEVFNHMDTMGINSLVSMLTGKPIPENILLSGSIGEGAYGAQWRKWDDTRLINYKDDKEYKKLIGLGYKDMNDDIYPGLVSESSPELRVMNKKIDQLADAIELIKNNPHSRRIIVSAWNTGKLDLMALPPCHTLFQFNVREDSDSVKYLSTTLFCRSQDFLVGTVANIAQYSILTHMVAQVTGCVAEKLTWFGSNVHIYENQVELALGQVDRFPYKNNVCVELNKDIKNIDDFKFEDIVITGYDKTLEPIKYPVAV